MVFKQMFWNSLFTIASLSQNTTKSLGNDKCIDIY